ncbi:MAG: hypothetical protein WC681_23930 [Sterolibacterium sp.]|jgi:hypothetical protein
MHTDAFLGLKSVLLAAALVFLGACGGGSGGDVSVAASTSSSTAASTSTTTATTTTTTLSPTGSINPSLAGVAATGAPLLGATVKVVDATGTAVGSGTTSTTDGAYRLVLDTPAAKTPLLIQAVGVDAGGNPAILHSLVRTSAVPLVANITPASNAVVAQVLGADPKTVFLKADSNLDSIARLGDTAIVTNASDLVKSIVKTNLTDAKIIDTKTLDFFQDAKFAANKTGLDAVLEGLRIQVIKDGSGKDVLQFSNKFNLLGATEVSVDLASAKAELTKTSGGSVAKAITSTIKATTSLSAVLTNLGVLDDLSIALNKLIAQGSHAADFLSAPALSSAYVSYNGRTRGDVADKLAEYAANNYQLSRMQVTGCADNPLVAKACTKVMVSALVTNAAGQKVEVFSDAVTYSKTTTPNWVLVGNGYSSDFAVYPVAVATFALDGTMATTIAAMPSSGVQLVVSLAAGDTANRTIQIPSGYSIPMAYCNLSYLCVKSSPTANPVATGELQDTLPIKLSLGTIGNLDSVTGAKYLASLAGSTVLIPAYLSANVPADLINAPFPMLDGIKTTPLTTADISSSKGLNLSWAEWAAANPDLKVFMVRALIPGSVSALYSDAALPPAPVTEIKVPGMSVPAKFTAHSYQVWLGAQDSLGRRYYSKFTSTP